MKNLNQNTNNTDFKVKFAKKTKYHQTLADFFSGKSLYLDEPLKELPNIRKFAEQPYQQICGENWEALEKTLTDLSFIEAKCSAKRSDDLVNDYLHSLGKKKLPSPNRVIIEEFNNFIKEQSHILNAHPYLTFQQAINQPDNSIPHLIAKNKLESGMINRPWFDLKNKQQGSSPIIFTRPINSDYVCTCAVSPDGHKIISQSQNNNLSVWDSETGTTLMELTGHSSWITCCAFTPSGDQIISASQDATIKVWDATNGILIMTIQGQSSIRSFSISPDGNQIVTIFANDKTVQVWDLKTGSLVKLYNGNFGQPRSCAISPNGRWIILGSDQYPYDEYNLHFLDAKSGSVLNSFNAHKDSINACCCFPDGKKVVSASSDGTVKVWNLKSGALIMTIDVQSESVNSCAVSPDGKRIVTASDDHSVKIWNSDNGKLIKTSDDHSGEVTACSFFPDGKRILSASYDQTIKVWNSEINPPLIKVDNHIQKHFNRGKKIIAHSCDQSIKIWDSESGQLIETYSKNEGQIIAIKSSAGCERILSINECPNEENTSYTVWDVETGKPVSDITDYRRSRLYDISPDGSLVVTKGKDDDTIIVWDAESGSSLAKIQCSHYSADFAFFPGGDQILLAYDKSPLKKSLPLQVWDINTGALLKTLAEPPGEISSLSITSDGSRAVAMCRSADLETNTINVWDLDTGSLLDIFKGSALKIQAFSGSFLADNSHLIVACPDKTIKIWDIKTCQLILSLKGKSPFALFPDGKKIAAASDENTLKIWDIENGSLSGELKVTAKEIFLISISPEGEKIIVTYYDNTLILYDVNTLQKLAVFATLVPVVEVSINQSGTIIARDFGNCLYILSPKYNYTVSSAANTDDHTLQDIHSYIKLKENSEGNSQSSASAQLCQKCGGQGMFLGQLSGIFLFFLFIAVFCVWLLPHSRWWYLFVIPVGGFSVLTILSMLATLFFGRKKCEKCGKSYYSLKKDSSA
jgi:WD40 repeat protein